MAEEADKIKELQATIDELMREKQQIISIVSHDIKAPLNRIFALVQLMQMDNENLTAQQQTYLDKVHQVVGDGLNMIRNLVDYRNIQYRSTEIIPEEINLKNFIANLIQSYKSLADKKNIVISLSADEVQILTDNQCLGRSVGELISNAIKFSSEGKEVFVSVKDLDHHVQIHVKDEASGFTDDDVKRLFIKFQKLSARPTAGESSTGLGFFIIKSMLEKIGGVITYETKPRVGSTFTITLPKHLA